MKTRSVWIIRLALTVQILGVLSVPALVASGRVDLDLSGVERMASTIERARWTPSWEAADGTKRSLLV